jgi:hypothetical protein
MALFQGYLPLQPNMMISGSIHLPTNNIVLLRYTDLPNVDTFYYTLFKKSHLLVLTQILPGRYLSIGELSNS